ncbi:DUF625-domain-containing protein [Coccomyxa subellipsoidea C-169]|uniref:DUF625-domain-containing protein n=1 Tax=Coccomyxa subellipsoidea (strain C-169) TaxID=574566 RepID=I0Z6D1_COCSC|nr:DUF625-domain-containing protein [Coccomyxa subellipsoidea C-169]EIE26200.1 DUF625-domain-containing protein [Coccomyxa subellipsoidea C-169]|eukprot:XP_005650744.1 DUF625-domain-containing protein [Coccomyxa subellipsoidea C-169]
MRDPVPTEFGMPDGTGRRGIVDEFEQASVAGEGDFPEGPNAGPVELPAAEMGSLPDLAKILSELSPFQRDRAAAQVLRPGYIRKLLEIFRQCEDLEDEESLRHMYFIVRGAIMLNDAALLEAFLSEENVMDTVGALEYDPELPEQQRHRAFLRDKVVFKEVVPIADPGLRAKIHQTYRLAYLKDVVLPRVLDDATFATFSSLILFNNVEVVMALQNDARFLPDLFERLKATGPGDEGWQDQVMMRVLKDGSDELRQRATDVLLSAVQHDATPFRDFFTKQPETDQFQLLLRPLLSGGDVGLQESVLEILRALLDPSTMTLKAESNHFLELFYDKYIAQLIAVLSDACEPGRQQSDAPGAAPSALALIVDLLCFCVQQHSYRIKYYVLRNNVVEKVLKLLNRREKWLVVAAVRFLRTCIGLKDDFYNRYLVRNNLFEPVLATFLANGERYNLLNSAVLEMVEYVRKENIKPLISHLVEQFGGRLAGCDYVDTFRNLKLKYEQNQEWGAAGEHDALPTPSTVAAQHALAESRQRRDERSLDKDEEDYFSKEDDDEDDGSGGAAAGVSGRVANGVAHPMGSVTGTFSLRSLVDYDDDEDEDTADGDKGMQKRGPKPARQPGSPLKRPRLSITQSEAVRLWRCSPR